MPDLTFPELKAAVGRKLRILADSETLSAEDGEVIGKSLLSLQAYLSRIGLVSLDVEVGLDRPWDIPIVAMTAALLVDDFEMPEPNRTALVRDGALNLPGRSLAERQLRALVDGVVVKLETASDTWTP